MLIPEIDLSQINKIQIDQYNRINAVFVIDKPIGLGSHDVVDQVRHILRTRHVGHAGALDPFASGMLLILVGKYTKYTDAFIAMDKSYAANILLGIKTLTQDSEGNILEQKDVTLTELPEQKKLEEMLSAKFQPGYLQFVPLFSSVKIAGQKLRVLARKAKAIKYLAPGKVELEMPGSNNTTEIISVNLPAKEIKISELQLKSIKTLDQVIIANEKVTGQFVDLELNVSCSKGTYIRQLAEDVGLTMGLPAYLQELRRTRVGDFKEELLCSISDIEAQALAANILPKEDKRLLPKLQDK